MDIFRKQFLLHRIGGRVSFTPMIFNNLKSI